MEKIYKKGGLTRTWTIEGGKILDTVEINGSWVSNPTTEMIEAYGWVEYVKSLDEVKKEKLEQITRYDESSAVNEFYLNGVSHWYDFDQRLKISKRIENDEAKGLSTTKLGDNGFRVEIPISTAKSLMSQLEDYATACYDVTNDHKYNVLELSTRDEVENYNYATGYPEKLSFDLNQG